MPDLTPEFMLIRQRRRTVRWPPAPRSSDPETLALRLAACLRDLDGIEAFLPAAYVETAIRHLCAQYGSALGFDDDHSGTD